MSSPFSITQVDIAIDDAELDMVRGCIEGRWLSEGPRAAEFAKALETRLGVRHVVFAPNATLGIWLALMALDLPKGAEVLVPSFTFYGSAAPVVFAGLKPVFVDCDPDTYNSTREHFAAALTPNTRAIMPIHIYGQASDMTGILAFAKEHRLLVIEDAAQGFGVTHKKQQAGSFGDIGIISFYSDKIITTGEGGAVLTNSDALYEKLRLLRNQGRPNAGTFVHPALGMNFRITDMQAAVGLAQLKKFEDIRDARLKKWQRYAEGLKNVGDLKPMQIHPDSNAVPFRFPVTSARRDACMAAMEKAGIQTRSFFYPMHLQPMLKSEPPQRLPISERLANEGFCLPIHHHLKDSDIDKVIDVLRKVF